MAVGATGFPILSRWTSVGWRQSRRAQRTAIAVAAGGILLIAIALDFRTSWFESLLFRTADRQLTYHVAKGPSNAIAYPAAGPYDWSLGYARMPVLLIRLQSAGYSVEAQARDSAAYAAATRAGLYPIYRHKDQAGLRITDRNGNVLYESDQPQRVFRRYSDIPPLAVESLLFIENRHMLDSKHPFRNPAVEWDRLSKAVVDYVFHFVHPSRPVIGGSTLATQLEKMRHSPGGKTHSAVEKFRQMATASLAAYQDGVHTLQAQREIIRGYINSIPLGASAGYGDVEGLADGLWAWYGADINDVSRLLEAKESTLSPAQMTARARAYREVLSLLLALRAPHYYLAEDRDALDAQTNRYLYLLCDRGIISPALRDLAVHQRIRTLTRAPQRPETNFIANKAGNSVRMVLLSTLGLGTAYELDRLDLNVNTTIDQPTQQGATQFLERIADPKQAAAAGLVGYELLDQGPNPGNVIYSFTLYEKEQGRNVLRAETDNLNQPLNINQDTKLELGSTAKLRTLINYLEIVSDLHKKYSGMTPSALKAVQILPDDRLTEWAVDYLSKTKDRSLDAMLQAALDRKFSAGVGESFFTAGGLHHFENFDSDFDGRIMTVRDAFHHSVNLVFIRIMRDIVGYYRFRVPGTSPAVLEDGNDPARRAYLARFADQEGRLFLSRFYDKYRGQTPNQALETLVKSISLTPRRAAVIYRSVRPWGSLDQFTAFLKAHFSSTDLAREDPEELYEKYGPDKFNLADRGYLAHVHPLELWLLNFLEEHRGAHLRDVYVRSGRERQDVYWWLFRTGKKHAQDTRIRTLLEQDAFHEIYKAWKRQGYPFDSLVPSYATTIGVSGDTPAALAELMGILVNGGVRYPTAKINRLHFGENTPTETLLERKLPAGERVIDPKIASAVRHELLGVVEEGTARRAFNSIVLPNGKVVPVGGKTGTGDNRLESFTAHGQLIGSKPVNRTATFVFEIGNRFYGTILAFVPGEKSGSYRFTSALAVQIFKDLAPQLTDLVAREEGVPPNPNLAVALPPALR